MRRRFGKSVWLRILVGAVGLTTALAAAVTATTLYVLPKPTAVLRIRNALPATAELEYVNRVTHSPEEWIEAVCERPPLQLHDYTRLPHASDTSSCRSLSKNGPPVVLMIARFPDEFLLQLDLGNEGYGFYAFAYDNGTLFTIATDSRASVTNGQGLGVSPALAPLERFGFNIYSGPGLP